MILGDLEIELVQKNIKNVHLSVLPPYGNVRIAAPIHFSEETIRLYAISKLGWIKKQQKKIRGQARETKREFVNKETHYLQGRKYLLRVIKVDKPARIEVQKRFINFYIRPSADKNKCQEIFNDFYRTELRKIVEQLLPKWEKIMRVKVNEIGVKKMKTKWGSCNLEDKRIWLNLELAKKPISCIEYILVHEMVHLKERHHNERFIAFMDKYLPRWRDHREELNSLPVGHVEWGY